ncbi:MAG: lipopolysaccharide kinase InaA family protein [Desulfuromonadales bacterium]
MDTQQGGSILKLKSGQFSGLCENTPSARALAASLLPDPDHSFATGDLICSPWHSAATDKVLIQLEGYGYFVKRYNCQGFGYKLRNLLRPSRALRSWHNGVRFQQAQVTTVPPILCLEERFSGLLGRSYVVFPHLTDAACLLNIWQILSPQEQREALLTLAETFGCMHRKGIFHGDLNWRNILVRKEEERLQFFLVDLDGCLYRRGYREKLARRDLEHFYRDMSRAAVTDELTRYFRKIWQEIVMG